MLDFRMPRDKLKFNKRVDHTSSVTRQQAFGRLLSSNKDETDINLPKACGQMINLV